mgnify:CR=1 FL=1
MRRNLFFVILFLSCIGNCLSQNLSASQIIEEACDYHDFNNALMTGKYRWHILEKRPGQGDNYCILIFDPANEYYQIKKIYDNESFEYIIEADNYKIKFNGSTSYSDEIAAKYQLTRKRAYLLRDYYYYLWYMPVKLKDKGTEIDPSASKTVFNGMECYLIDVSYPLEDDAEIWQFYFDTKQYYLTGYAFQKAYHSSVAEYILLDEEVVHESLRIPKIRKWYDSSDDQYLGEDILLSLERVP